MLLERHAWRLRTRIDAVANVLDSYSHPPLGEADHFPIERAIVQLQIEWEHFVRNVVLDSATGKFRAKSGLVRSNLPVKVTSREHACFILIEQYKRRNHEPDWYLPNDAIQAANKLAITNEQTIITELGVSPWELDDLRHLRNFITHRSRRSALCVRETGCIDKSDRLIPSAICFSYTSGGVRRYESWIKFMKTVGNRMVE